jgi:hypothetical protein
MTENNNQALWIKISNFFKSFFKGQVMEDIQSKTESGQSEPLKDKKISAKNKDLNSQN